MKSLIKWILFVPVCLMSVLLVLLSGLAPDMVTNLFSTDINGIAEIISFAVLGLFLVCFVISLFERKTAPVYLLKKNYFAGVTGVLSAFALAATAALDVTTLVRATELDVLGIINIVFTALSGVAMLFVGLNHFSGVNTAKATSILYLSLPLWCGVHLVDRFMKHTASPVAAAETLDLIMFVALAMFLIYAMMVHAVIPSKNTVKYAIVFGFPTSVICLVYSIAQIFTIGGASTADYLSYIPAVSYGLLGLYTLAFTAELMGGAKTVDELTVVEAETDEESYDGSNEYFIEGSDTYSDEIQRIVPADAVADESLEEDESSESCDSDIDKIRIAEEISEAEEEALTEENYSDDVDEDDIALELFMAAQKRDEHITEEDSEAFSAGSEEEMIIDGEFDKTPSFVRTPKDSANKPKGPVSREAVMFDEDFILSIDSKDTGESKPIYDESEDISAFILEKSDLNDDDQVAAKNKYDARLDEIDKLIISIQGGDSNKIDD